MIGLTLNQSWISSLTKLGCTSPKSPWVLQPVSSTRAARAIRRRRQLARALTAIVEFTSQGTAIVSYQRTTRRRRRLPELLPVSGSRPFDPSGGRSIRITGRMMTVAGSLVASTYLPSRAQPAPSGNWMTSPIAIPFSVPALKTSSDWPGWRLWAQLRRCKVNGLLTAVY